MRARTRPMHASLFRRELNAKARALILDAVAAAGGNRTRAAAALGLRRTYMLRLIRQHNLAADLPTPPKTAPRNGRSQP